MTRSIGLWLGLLAMGLAGAAQATLIDRGGGLIYDDVLDITWLQNADLAASNTFGVSGINAVNGSMSWTTAEAWIAAMNSADYLGYSDWRLPTMLDTNAPGCDLANVGTDCGYNVQTTAGPTVYSEMGSLYYDSLGNLGLYDATGAVQPGFGPSNTADFLNVQSDVYWFGLEYAPNPSGAWTFHFYYGDQHNVDKDNEFFAWAVRPGDVAATVPAPGTLVLLGLGLAGLVGARGRRHSALR